MRIAGIVYYPLPQDTWESTSTPFLFLDKYQPKEKQLEVEISVEDLNWALVEKVKLWLRYRDRNNDIDEKEMVTLTENDDSFLWRVKLEDAIQQEYKWKARFYLRDPKRKVDRKWNSETADFIDLEEVLADLL